MTPRNTKLLIFIVPLLAAFSIWSVYDFIRRSAPNDTQAIVTQFVTAQKRMEKSPASLERAEKFVHDLKMIKTGNAPEDVKQGLAAYISATEQGVAALRAGQDLTQSDRAIAESKQALLDAIEKKR